MFTNPKESATGQTVGATSLELVTTKVDNVAALMINAMCLGYDEANPTQTVQFAQMAGGGINLGVLTLLPALFGGTQKSLSLITANVTVTLSGGFMVLTVTGVAGKTINWGGRLELLNL